MSLSFLKGNRTRFRNLLAKEPAKGKKLVTGCRAGIQLSNEGCEQLYQET